MRYLITLFFLICGFAIVATAQSTNRSVPDFSLLEYTNTQLAADHVRQEALLDQVEVSSMDEKLHDTWTPHQPFFMGRFFKWKKINAHKTRFIGTATRKSEMYHNAVIKKEYDVCLFLIPHLQKYIDLDH